jgi:hypothetical protein
MQNIKSELRVNLMSQLDENINGKFDNDFIDNGIMIINVHINAIIRDLLWVNIRGNIDYAKYNK